MPRFPSTSPAGLRAVSRVAVCQGMGRPSALLISARLSGTTRIVTSAARPRQGTAFDGKERYGGNSAHCRLTITTAVSDCVHASPSGDAKRKTEVRYATKTDVVRVAECSGSGYGRLPRRKSLGHSGQWVRGDDTCQGHAG